MDTIKTVDSLESVAREESGLAPVENGHLASEIRSLGDWELVLAAGGEGTPCWP